MLINRPNSAFSLAEVVVAVLIIAVCVSPVFYALTSSRTDTSKAINYLRAVELANEAIDWASNVDFKNLNNETMSAYNGSLVEENSGELFAVQVGADDKPDNKYWQNLNADLFSYSELAYSDDYNKCYFVREINVEDVYSNEFGSGFAVNDNLIKKVTVCIKWNEGHKPSSINSLERDRQIELSALVFNDQSLEY